MKNDKQKINLYILSSREMKDVIGSHNMCACYGKNDKVDPNLLKFDLIRENDCRDHCCNNNQDSYLFVNWYYDEYYEKYMEMDQSAHITKCNS